MVYQYLGGLAGLEGSTGQGSISCVCPTPALQDIIFAESLLAYIMWLASLDKQNSDYFVRKFMPETSMPSAG